jgi:DNA primase
MEIMNREVSAARRNLHVHDEDAYVSRNHRQTLNQIHERGENPSASMVDRKKLEHQDAQMQGYFRIDDAVFICEQQFMGILIQVPRAVNREMFAQLDEGSFTTPVFRSLFQAVDAAGGLPSDDTPQGLWMHNVTKATGPWLQQVINELAVMPLPLPQDDNANGGRQSAAPESNAAAVQLRPPTVSETQYASELLVRLLDMGYMRRIAVAKRRMNQMTDGTEKFSLLGDITKLETARKDLQAQVYGNTVS